MDNHKKADPAALGVSVVVEPFEKDLVRDTGNIASLQKRYGSFLDLFSYQVIRVGTADTQLLKVRLSDFAADADIRKLYAAADAKFENRQALNAAFTDAFAQYKYNFPGKHVPRVISFISGFNYAVVSADSVLGIGLDMYLGSEAPWYANLGLPAYKIRRMDRGYLVADAMRGWVESEWEQIEQPDLISQFIYHGKIQYLLDRLLPEASDSVKTGYTASQIQWCEENEKMIWTFFIDQQLLFINDASRIAKFTGDAPTTNGFPKESPGNIGRWVGWQIVKSYMEKNPQVTPLQVMDETDHKKIFREAGYKPKK